MVYPTPSLTTLSEYYPKNYYSYDDEDTHDQKPQWILAKIQQQVLADRMNGTQSITRVFFDKRFLRLPEKKVTNWRYLDIGCWAAKHFWLLKQYGRDCYGFEFWEKSINEKKQITYWSSLHEWKRDQKFDYITMRHSLEHIVNPEDYISTIKKLLKDNWTYTIWIPNTNSRYAKLFGKYRYGSDTPRHVFNYNPKNITQLLQKHWLKVVRVLHQSCWGGRMSLLLLLEYKLWIKLDILKNLFFIWLFYPIDILANIFKQWDIIAIKVVHA